DVVGEHLRQPRVPSLRHPRRLLRRRALLGIVVDVEVSGLEDLEVEGSIQNLVAPEILGVGGGSARQAEQHGSRERGKPGGDTACGHCLLDAADAKGARQSGARTTGAADGHWILQVVRKVCYSTAAFVSLM